jgi:putative FmdB family regulatory protein
MPTYEYRCKDCSHELEAQQSFTDDPLTTCPSCGGTLRKKFSSPGISFKGSGFYKTDSRSAPAKSSSSSAKSDSSTSSDSGGSADSSSSGSDSAKPTPSSGAASSGTSSSGDGAGKTAAAVSP